MGVGAVQEDDQVAQRVAALEERIESMSDKLDRVIALALPGLAEPDRGVGRPRRIDPQAG